MAVLRQYALICLAVIAFAVVHEGAHALSSAAFGEYGGSRIRWYGAEVEYRTPMPEREGLKWGFISGSSSAITILCGFLMFVGRGRIAASGNPIVRIGGYYATALFMLGDPLNLSVGPFIYGGDIGGLAVGFHMNRYAVQIVLFALFLLNRELVARYVLPAFGVRTRHVAFRPWFARS
jgi:hypothetical protein